MASVEASATVEAAVVGAAVRRLGTEEVINKAVVEDITADAEDITVSAEATPTKSPSTVAIEVDLEAVAELITVDAEEALHQIAMMPH